MTLEDIFVCILGTVLFFMVWLCIGFGIRLFLIKRSWYEKIIITYRFRIPERFKTKVDPIYELKNSEWDDTMIIKKWSLMEYEKDWHELLSSLFLYPIRFISYGYQLEDSVSLCKRSKLEDVQGTLEENYERIWGKNNAEHLRDEEIRKKRKNIINNLNQTFNENFE
jgi:hypothetical protein